MKPIDSWAELLAATKTAGQGEMFALAAIHAAILENGGILELSDKTLREMNQTPNYLSGTIKTKNNGNSITLYIAP